MAVVCAIAALGACNGDSEPIADPPPAMDDRVEPIVTFGHGTFVGRGGKQLPPSAALFAATRAAYIARLEPQVTGAAATRTRIRGEVQDEALADALYIEWLVGQAQPGDRATIKAVTGAMRNREIDARASSPEERRALRATKGIGSEAAQRLDASGISARVTYNGGQKYIDECAESGVPIPPPMFREGKGAWQRLGSFNGSEVISDTTPLDLDGDGIDEDVDVDPELWMYRSTAPEGVCLALPRYVPAAGGQIALLGLICLGTGTATPKACFWDNPDVWAPGVERPITQFVGGFDLEANAQGVCSDCHAGENPFVIHPEVEQFEPALGSFGTDWYEPIVHPTWPQNPGPMRALEAVASDGRCTSCHTEGGSGRRLPQVSRALAGYCDMVLAGVALDDFTTAADEAWQRTMPMGGGDHRLYRGHLERLAELCQDEPLSGKFVAAGTNTPSSFLSRPRLVGPLYACASRIAVRDVVLDARVRVTVRRGGVPTVYEQTAKTTTQLDFAVAPLEIGDEVTVDQIIDGMMSSTDVLTVRDHTLDYPKGLPAPLIDPADIYECASVLAVRHVPGATIQVQVNEGSDIWVVSGGDWTGVRPGSWPFIGGDEFRARITMCPGDAPSLWSGEPAALAAPSPLSTPRLDPERTFAGQRLVTVSNLTNGTKNAVSVSGTPAGDLMSAVSWVPDVNLGEAIGRALVEGDTVRVVSELCPTSKPVVVTTAPTAKCSELIAPRVEWAGAGASYIVMGDWVPGARIAVFLVSSTGVGTKIGENSGLVITLSRTLVAGDRIRVTQRLGENCTSSRAHQIVIR